MKLIEYFKALRQQKKRVLLKKQFGYCGKNVDIQFDWVYKPENLYLYDDTNIFGNFTFITDKGRFIMKSGSGAAQGLTVIAGSHNREVGKKLKDQELFYNKKGNVDSDVVVEEDVWIGANVTLLPGIVIGRGSTIGAGAVVRYSVPPYAVVLGNPAKVIGFNFNPEEVLKHEEALYPQDQRLSLDLLERNYNKYYINRINEIKNFLKH